MSSGSFIYLDNAATTCVSDEVASVTLAAMRETFGNPSSAHHAGIAAERAIKLARQQLCHAIGDRDSSGNLVWTSGGTESDALGVLGAARVNQRRGKRILHSAIEHPAVTKSAAMLQAEGWTSEAIPVDRHGVIDLDRTMAMIDDQTTVIAVMLVNNEIGTIQPVAELARELALHHPAIHLHCDAVQALGKIKLDVTQLGAHSVAFAAHKIHGPKGVGALWIAPGRRIAPLWAGGGQQEGIRAGTYNVPGIAGLGAAALAATTDFDIAHNKFIRQRDQLLRAAQTARCDVAVNGAEGQVAPHILSLGFTGIPAEPLLHVLESRGVLVSAGSACSERDRKPSPVLTAIGLGADVGTIRLSLGRDTTADDIDRASDILPAAVNSFV